MCNEKHKVRGVLFAVLIMCFACVGYTVAADSVTNTPLPWKASVCCKRDNVIFGPLSPGDDVQIKFFIQNVSTNIQILSKDSWIRIEWMVNPEKYKDRIFGGMGSEGYYICMQSSPPTQGWINNAVEYCFFKPGVALRYTYDTKVPQDIPNTATNIGFSAYISTSDTGADFGLNAWTGTITMTPFIVPLVHTNIPDETDNSTVCGDKKVVGAEVAYLDN